jgi:LysR family cyn operon transcriptional activator
VEIHQLTCFVAVAEEGGFNRASARLRMTQPAISYHVKQLEQELGLPLFYRRPRGISLTEAGRVLLQHSRQLILMVRTARYAIDRLSGGVTGEVRIGTVNSVGMYLLPKVLENLRATYPEVRPTILYRNAPEIVDALISNQIDMAILANPARDRRFNVETLLVENISLVCGRIHPFFGRTRVTPEDLMDANFICLTEENPTGRLVRDYMEQIGVTEEPVVSTDNVETVKKMVEIGLGVALLPDMVTGADIVSSLRLGSKLARIEVPPPVLERSIVLATWKKLDASPASKAFVKLLRETCETWKNGEGGARNPADTAEPDGDDAD